MNSTVRRMFKHGFVFTELLVVLGIVAIMAAMLVFLLMRSKQNPPRILNLKSRSQEINCVNNLKQIGLAYRIWEGDHGDKYPMSVSTAKGGTMQFTTGADTFRHFQVMSNELWTPKVLICPSDTRIAAANYVQLKNQNVSYFVGLDANDSNPQMLLSGDRNLAGPSKTVNGILKLAPGDAANWTATMHVNQGNIGLADGSVQHYSNTGLRAMLKNSGDATNVWRFALPE
jgi:prepilin-type N-terminal cleavage/methylation domain-containing protein